MFEVQIYEKICCKRKDMRFRLSIGVNMSLAINDDTAAQKYIGLGWDIGLHVLTTMQDSINA